MSLQAALVTFGVRHFIKRHDTRKPNIHERRRALKRYEHWVPSPPAGTQSDVGMLGPCETLHVARPLSDPRRHVLYLHGGGYVAGSPRLYAHMMWRLADAARAHVWAPEYRLAPEHPFPAALNDAAAAWNGLLAANASPARCVLAGDSAGGGLALALAKKLRDEGQPQPAAIAALSPWTDLNMSGSSCRLIDDPMLNLDDLEPLADAYLAGESRSHPYASPLYGDLRGLPPVLLQVGGNELMREDSVRMATRLEEASVEVMLEIWPRMLHVWHAFAPIMPEARHAIARVGAFILVRTTQGRISRSDTE